MARVAHHVQQIVDLGVHPHERRPGRLADTNLGVFILHPQRHLDRGVIRILDPEDDPRSGDIVLVDDGEQILVQAPPSMPLRGLSTVMGGNDVGTGTGFARSLRTDHRPAPLNSNDAAKQTSNTAITTKRHLRGSCFLERSLSDNSQRQRVSSVSMVTISWQGNASQMVRPPP